MVIDTFSQYWVNVLSTAQTELYENDSLKTTYSVSTSFGAKMRGSTNSVLFMHVPVNQITIYSSVLRPQNSWLWLSLEAAIEIHPVGVEIYYSEQKCSTDIIPCSVFLPTWLKSRGLILLQHGVSKQFAFFEWTVNGCWWLDLWFGVNFSLKWLHVGAVRTQAADISQDVRNPNKSC